MTSRAKTTQLLIDWRQGNDAALAQLVPRVYRELRGLANHYLGHERAGHTLQPTALVHEAYLRLIDDNAIDWQNRAHFFGIAAMRMRHILVDHARSRLAAKRGKGAFRLSLSDIEELPDKRDIDLLALDDALARLDQIDAEKARLVELRYFGGLTIEETAEVLGISPASVKRGWTMARADNRWL